MQKFLAALLMMTSSSLYAQQEWQNLSSIPKAWLMLERDSAGYLVYDPCNGGTPMIKIESRHAIVFWRLDAHDTFLINKFTPIHGEKSFYISAAGYTETFDFNVTIKDIIHNLFLWSFGDTKWVMTPMENKDKFRNVKNPCPGEMKPEIVFLPVEF